MCAFSIDIGPVRSHQDDLKSKVGCTSSLRARLLSSIVESCNARCGLKCGSGRLRLSQLLALEPDAMTKKQTYPILSWWSIGPSLSRPDN